MLAAYAQGGMTKAMVTCAILACNFYTQELQHAARIADTNVLETID